MNKTQGAKILFIVGLPGSGKDFVSRLIQKYFEQQNKTSIRCCVGNELRELKAVKPSGELSDLNTIHKIIKNFLDQRAELYILDGFPRSSEQLHIVMELAPKAEMQTLILNCSEEIAKKRLSNRFSCSKCLKAMSEQFCRECEVDSVQRLDDLEDAVIERRIKVYLDFIPSIIQILKIEKIPIHYINAEKPHLEVEEEVLSILDQISKQESHSSSKQKGNISIK